VDSDTVREVEAEFRAQVSSRLCSLLPAFNTHETRQAIRAHVQAAFDETCLRALYSVETNIPQDDPTRIDIRLVPRIAEDRPTIVFDLSASEEPDSFYYDSMKSWLIGWYGHKRGTFLANRLAKDIRRCKDMCLSHLRVADTGIPSEMREYERIRESGCCGFSDNEVTFEVRLGPFVIAKEKYMIGFNYGH
jgi:hypothetical protein